MGGASACCGGSLEICAYVIAAGYLHPYVLGSFLLPPVTLPCLSTLNDRRRECPRQACRVVGLEVGNINAKPDALGGITAFSRIRRLRDLGLRGTQLTS